MRYDVGRFRRPMRRSTEGQMMSLISLGDGSTLTLDFTTGQLDPRLTFTRASTVATFINASGLVATATTNEPRFDHDPTTLAPRGLLIEGSASNVLQYSVAVNQSPWFVAGGVTRTTFTGGIGPDGVNNSGSKLSAVNISSSSSLYYNGVSFTSGTTYTYSVWAKADGANWIWISFHFSGAQHGAFFDLSGNGALGNTTGTVVSGSNTITKYPNGWFRLTVAHTAASTSFYFPVLLPCTSNGTGFASIAGQSPNGVLVYGAQLETGSGASSYIPTGASTVQRLGDSCVMTGANFSSWFAGATEGVLFTEFEKPRSQSGTIGHDHASVGSRYASGSSFIVYSAASVYYPTTLLWPTGGVIFPGGIASAIPSVSKQAGRWFGGNDATNFANGVQGTTSAGTGTLTPTMLSIGANSTSGTQADRDWLNACVRRVKFWPVALPNSQIIALTT